MEQLGKLLILLAGLAVLLDLIGVEPIAAAKRTAIDRQQQYRGNLTRLRLVSQLNSLARTIAWSVLRSNSMESEYFTPTEFENFAAECRQQIAASRMRRLQLRVGDVSAVYHDADMFQRSMNFLSERLDADSPERQVLDEFQVRHERHSSRIFRLLGPLFIFVGIPLGVWLAIEIRSDPNIRVGLPDWLLAVIAISCFNALILYAVGAASSTRVNLVVKIGLATVARWSTGVVAWLVGEDDSAKRVRWIALVLFIVGSLLDLIVSL